MIDKLPSALRPRCMHPLLDTLLGRGVDGAAQALAAVLPDTEKLSLHLRHLKGKEEAISIDGVASCAV